MTRGERVVCEFACDRPTVPCVVLVVMPDGMRVRVTDAEAVASFRREPRAVFGLCLVGRDEYGLEVAVRGSLVSRAWEGVAFA